MVYGKSELLSLKNTNKEINIIFYEADVTVLTIVLLIKVKKNQLVKCNDRYVVILITCSDEKLLYYQSFLQYCYSNCWVIC